MPPMVRILRMVFSPPLRCLKRPAEYLDMTRSNSMPRIRPVIPARQWPQPNKLINLEVVGVIGAYCSSSTIPASTTLDEEDIIMITPASTNEKVTDRGLPYMFRMCGRDDDQAPAAAKFHERIPQSAKTLFIVDDKTTYSQGLADGVSKGSARIHWHRRYWPMNM